MYPNMYNTNPYNLNTNPTYTPQQPINNIINANAQPNDFEAKFINDNDNPSSIIITKKTAFINLSKGALIIKEVNGDIKEYKILLPKTEEQLKIEELTVQNMALNNKLLEMEAKINEFRNNSTIAKEPKSNTNVKIDNR